MSATAGREADAAMWTKARTKSERVRERYQATLAGLLELEVLRAKHKQMVEVALGSCNGARTRQAQDTQLGNYQYWLEGDPSRLRLTRSLSEEALSDLERCNTAQSWSRHSSEDLLLDSAGHSDESPEPRRQQPQRQQPASAWDDSCSRASSGFCEDDMSDTCSEDADVSFLCNSFTPHSTPNSSEVSGTLRGFRPIMMKRAEEQSKVRDDGLTLADMGQEVIPQDGFFSVASLYPDSHWPDVSEILQPQVVLEPRYRSDLRSRLGAEVYRYPSPLHAVALQSPLYAPQSPIRQDRSLGHGSMRPGSRPPSVYLRSQTDFVGMSSESTSMTVMSPGRGCQTLPRVPCEKHRLEALIARLAQCNQHLINQPSLPAPQRANPASSLRRTCSMGKGRISDNKHKCLKRCEKTDTMPESMSSSRTLQNVKSDKSGQSEGVCKGKEATDTALLASHPDDELVSVSGSKKPRESQDVAYQKEQSSPGIGIFSPGCFRRRSTVVCDLPVELAMQL